jgi:hypothetical protein
MTWRPLRDAEAELGTRLHRKLAAGTVPTYVDRGGQRWVWAAPVAQLDDAVWELLAELRSLRGQVARLEARVDELEGSSGRGAAAPPLTVRLHRPELPPTAAPGDHADAAADLLSLRASAQLRRRFMLVDEEPGRDAC